MGPFVQISQTHGIRTVFLWLQGYFGTWRWIVKETCENISDCQIGRQHINQISKILIKNGCLCDCKILVMLVQECIKPRYIKKYLVYVKH